MKNSPTSRFKEGGNLEKHQILVQKFKNLKKQWESLEKSRPRNPRTCSTGSDSCSVLTTSFDLLLENSPRMLISTLQQSVSSSDGELSVKHCENAFGEILSDRRSAIMSGRLKGRRLFWPEEEVDLSYSSSSGDGGIYSDGLNMIQEKKVRVKECDQLSVGFNRSCSSVLDSCLSEEKVVVEKKMVVEVAKVVDGGGGRGLRGSGGCGGRSMAAMAWFGFVLIMFTVGLISISCNGDEMILVPT